MVAMIAADADFTYWNSPDYYVEYVQKEASSLFDNEYYIKQDNEEIYNLLIRKKSLKLDTEFVLSEESKNVSAEDISKRISDLLTDLNLSKSTAASFFNVSRPTLYSWLDGKTSSVRSANLEKLEWLESFSKYVPDDLKLKISLYKNRKLGAEAETLEDIIIKSNILPKEAGLLLVESIDKKQDREPFGSWKKNKNKGSIVHLSEAYTDNG
ncbi:MAG: hypothetical protein KUG81_05155 [Gammaproteobacteria bacterium]|nr:hypothetical protein [Gammaproteobacteria bacterium]